MPSTRTLIITISSIVVIVLGVTYWFISDLDSSIGNEKVSSESSSDKSEPIDPDRYIDDGEPLISEDGIPSENKFQEYIHGMTHQKVVAKQKWVIHPITDERIDSMLAVLEKIEGTPDEYEHFAFYLETLNEWDKENFQNAVEVHNHIWRLNGGTIGKAKRLMTNEEEQKYIDKHH
ncbi:DUF6241 domain-containing protein [Pseudalkalibacillus hwajinpoensis]|uniref:Uncharacterized protein n=1 Tax=Guptibacillus hwajinpoensis TaxID=208199 RepID=A0A4U1MJJ5_9BACL|nr:DUF6241 domain-containing protein [Pseudalkalibacillus hwajinpoensis]TKD71263.1 hypothetical protein FBF83_00170 [Pseudalkalibacillus hwajinpoensis]